MTDFLFFISTYIYMNIYVLMRGTNLFSEKEHLGCSSHACQMRNMNFIDTIKYLSMSMLPFHKTHSKFLIPDQTRTHGHALNFPLTNANLIVHLLVPDTNQVELYIVVILTLNNLNKIFIGDCVSDLNHYMTSTAGHRGFPQGLLHKLAPLPSIVFRQP